MQIVLCKILAAVLYVCSDRTQEPGSETQTTKIVPIEIPGLSSTCPSSQRVMRWGLDLLVDAIDYSHARDKIMTQSLNRIINTSVHSLFWRETIKSLGEGMRRYLPLKTSKVNKYLLGEGRRLYYSGMSLGLSIFWEILCLVSKVCLLFKLSLCLEAQTMQKCKKFMKKNTFNK